MSKRKPEPWISVPYTELMELFELIKVVKQLKQENKRINEQLLSLRLIQQECLEKIRQIDRYL